MKRLLLLLLLVSPDGYAQRKTSKIIDPGFIKTENLLWDLKQLSIQPEIQWINQTEKVHSLLYRSVSYEGKPTQVFAYYSNPDLIQGKTASKKKFPGIVLIHGGGGTAFREWVEKWAAEGYAAIAMDLSGNGKNGQKIAQPGPDQSEFYKFGKIETGDLKDVWTYHSVASAILAHSFLLNRPEVDPTRTAVTGISWGGYLTCLVASLDNRFKAAVPVYGCAYYDESDIFKQSLAKLSPEGRQKWLQYFDPAVYLPYAQPRFLFVNGNKDKFYNVVPYHKTYRLIPEDRRAVCIIPDMKHSHDWGWEPHEIGYFFDHVLNENGALPRAAAITRTDSTLSMTYASPVSPWTADFYFTNDTLSLNENRTWIRKKVKINREKSTFSTTIPPEGFKYGFFYFKDHRNITSSSEFIIK